MGLVGRGPQEHRRRPPSDAGLGQHLFLREHGLRLGQAEPIPLPRAKPQ